MVVIEIHRDVKQVVSTRLGSSRSARCLMRRPRTSLIFSSLRLFLMSRNHALSFRKFERVDHTHWWMETDKQREGAFISLLFSRNNWESRVIFRERIFIILCVIIFLMICEISISWQTCLIFSNILSLCITRCEYHSIIYISFYICIYIFLINFWYCFLCFNNLIKR